METFRRWFDGHSKTLQSFFTSQTSKRVAGISLAPAAERSRSLDLWQHHRLQILIVAVFVSTGIFLFPSGKSFQSADLREGEIYEGEEIIAPFTFSINKTSEEYERDKRQAREGVFPIFVHDDSLEAQQLRALSAFLASVAQNLEALVPDSLKARRLREFFAARPHLVISEQGLQFLLRGFWRYERPPANGWRFSAYTAQLERIARDLLAFGILSLEQNALPGHVRKISVRHGAEERLEPFEQFTGLEGVKTKVLQKLRELPNLSDPAVNIGYQILTNFLRPNLLYNASETQQRLQDAENKVPRARGAVLAKERIIESHDKITPEHLQKLRSLNDETAKRRTSAGGWRWIFPILGRAAILLIGIGIIGVFLLLSRPRLYDDPPHVLLITLILLLVIFICHLITLAGLSEYLIPAAIAPMLFTLFFDAQVGFVGAVALGIILGGMRGYEFSTIFTTLIVGLFSILAVRRVRSRHWIFKAILLIAAGYAATIATTAFLRHTPFPQMLQHLRDGILINALLCPIFTYGLMVIFEYLFDLTTDATLLELSALNRPLLRELALQAPGTYHHSIVVGTLAEAAAEAIGANSLLARVGAYYHDIGKMEKAEYFAENQRGGKNLHEKLTPNMSLLVIVNHVKRGLEIAEENNIPKEVRDFIPEHHGTNVISYFYKKALEKSEDSEVHESDFRYPGPKPQRKETGIVMLADAVEAAGRALRDPSPSRLRSMVNGIVEERFKKGELDECPLTLRDLNLIKESFIRTLAGIFHGRTQYPEDPKTGSENTPAETTPNKIRARANRQALADNAKASFALRPQTIRRATPKSSSASAAVADAAMVNPARVAPPLETAAPAEKKS